MGSSDGTDDLNSGIDETIGLNPEESSGKSLKRQFPPLLLRTVDESLPHGDGESLASSDGDRYELKGEIARGGMGKIIQGRDKLLGRDLAIKVLLDTHRDKPEVVRRFVEEAQISGQLQHPGIVPVHELGQLDDSLPFFAMKLVKGQTLRELLEVRKTPAEDLSRFLGIFEQICQTMAYAHSRGVIHRDLKPANIMVGAFGEVQVMDWGLAKVLDGEDNAAARPTEAPTETSAIRTIRSEDSNPSASGSQTHMGSVIGTPAYMPPEQALGEVDRLDERADVFGIGAILCAILTGEPPYVGKNTTDIMRQAARGQLQDGFARLDDCGADEALIAMAKRCLAHDPDERPRDATAVAGEISAYLESVATRLRQAELDHREAQIKIEEERKRRRVTFALAASIALTVMLGSGGWILLQNQQTQIARAAALAAKEETSRQARLTKIEESAKRDAILARNREAELRQQSQEAKLQAELTLADVYTSRGLLAAENDDSAMAMMWFATAAQQSAGDPDRHASNHLRARNWSNSAILPVAAFRCSPPAEDVQFEPNGKRLLIKIGRSGYVAWDWTTDTQLPWLNENSMAQAACWDPRGSAVALAASSQLVQIRSVPEGKILHEFSHPEAIRVLQYSRDGRYVAVASNVVHVFDNDAGELLDVEWDHGQPVDAVLFNATGTRLATTTGNQHARVFAVDDPTRKTPLYGPLAHTPLRPPSPPAFINDGLLTVTGRSELSWWDAETGELRRTIDTSPIWTPSGVVASPQGDKFAVGGYFGPDVWNVDDVDGERLHVGHDNFVDQMVFSSDGSLMTSASWDSTVRLLSLDARRELGKPLEHNIGTHRTDISNDNSLLATTQDNGLVRIWRRPQKDHVLATAEGWGTYIRLSFDGRYVTPGVWHASPIENSALPSVTVYEVASTKPAGPSIVAPGECVDSCVCTDNKSVAVVSTDGMSGWLTRWDIATGRATIDAVALPDFPVGVSARPGVDQLAVLCANGRLAVLDATGKELFASHPPRSEARRPMNTNAAYSPDGKRLVLRAADHLVHVLDPDNGKPLYPAIRPLFNGRTPCQAFAFSADSRLLATGSNGAARVWDLNTGEELCDPLVHPDDPSGLGAIAFSPDGRQLLTGNSDSLARLWDWKSGTLVCPPLKHTDTVFAVAITPDGKYAVTGSRGRRGGPHVWDLTTGRPVAPIREGPENSTVPPTVRSMAIAPDGSRLIASSGMYADLELIDLARLVEPPEIPIDTLRILAELATSHTIELGDTNAITMDQWSERWQRLSESRLEMGYWSPEESIARRRAAARQLASASNHASATAHLNEALAELERAELDESHRLMLRVQILSDRAEVAAARSDDAASARDIEDARALMEQALAAKPNDAALATQLAELLIRHAAVNDDDSLASRLPAAVRALKLHGLAALGSARLIAGDHDAAIAALQQQLEDRSNPDSPPAVDLLLLLSLAQHRGDQPDPARKSLEQGKDQLTKVEFTLPLQVLTFIAMVEVDGQTQADAYKAVHEIFFEQSARPLTLQIEKNPTAADGYAKRGEWYGSFGRWDAAAADLSKAFELDPPNHYIAYHLSSLLANREDLSAYRDHCKLLLKEWGDTTVPHLADRTLTACLLDAKAVDDTEKLQQLLEVVEATAGAHQFHVWFLRGQGLYAYRTGEHTKALEACVESRRINGPTGSGELTAANHVIEAMAHHELGDSQTATKSLDAATKTFESLGDPAKGGRLGSWHDWLMAKILYREAEKLLSQ